MSDGFDNEPTHDVPEAGMHPDDALARELDAALGDEGLASLMDTGAGPSAAGAPSSAGEGVRTGRVIAIHGDDIFVDMGGKSQGVLSAEQYETEEPLPKVGDAVEVTIEGYDRTDGLLLLSRKGAVMAATWQKLEEGLIVEGRVTGHNKGGLELSLDGIPAFMPISHIELFRVEELAPYVNRRLKCQVIEVSEEERKVIVSARAVHELEAAEARERAFSELVEGQTVSGVVRSVMPYGAFVTIADGVDGLLHVSEMAHTRVEDPNDVVKEGQKLEVMVTKIDPDSRKIGLSLKKVLPDPWADAAARWPVDEIVSARVTRLMDFGAFVEVEEGVEALVPISEMTYERRIGHPREILNEGDVVKARVLAIDPERKRMSLSIKRVGDDPWMGASVRWPVNSVVDGTVKRITEFGAFVELTPGVEGLIHISELSETPVRQVSEVVREGDTVRAAVVSVDEERRRIGLSIKQLTRLPDYTGPVGEAPAEPAAPKKKRKKPLKGGLDW
jgi:small subunit ribosomal protein S1